MRERWLLDDEGPSDRRYTSGFGSKNPRTLCDRCRSAVHTSRKRTLFGQVLWVVDDWQRPRRLKLTTTFFLVLTFWKKIVFCFVLVDELWYRAICVKVPNDLDKNNDYLVYFLDWGMEYLTNIEDIKKMPKDFIYLPATAYKCYVKGTLWYHSTHYS